MEFGTRAARFPFVDYMTTKLTSRQQGGWRSQVESQLFSFGARLRELRLQRGWTLDELAQAGGFSKAFLSRLESGGRQPAIASALTLARILEVSLGELFESPLATEPCVIIQGAEAVDRTARGLTYAPLSKAGRFFNLQPLRVKISPTRRGCEHYHHDGEEWVYVLSGALTLSLAGKTYDLAPGDAAHFDSRLPHRLIARGKAEAEVLVVASPLSEPVPTSRSSRPELRAIPTMRLLGDAARKDHPWIKASPNQPR